MRFYPQEKVALFVDGANIYSASKALQFNIDYKKVLEVFGKEGILVRAFYYTAMVDPRGGKDENPSPLKPLVDWLGFNGYTTVTKIVKEYTDDTGRTRMKGNMDIELAIDMLNMAQYVDHIVLFSGDGDFRKLIEEVQKKGVRVTVVSTRVAKPPMISDDLRRQADQFIELDELRSRIEKDRSDD